MAKNQKRLVNQFFCLTLLLSFKATQAKDIEEAPALTDDQIERLNSNDAEYVYLSNDFRDSILKSNETLPEHKFSQDFNEVFESLKSGESVLPEETARGLVNEYSKALESAGQTQDLSKAKEVVKEYVKALDSGDASIFIDPSNDENNDQIKRSVVCNLFVRDCLQVGGDLNVCGKSTFNGGATFKSNLVVDGVLSNSLGEPAVFATNSSGSRSATSCPTNTIPKFSSAGCSQAATTMASPDNNNLFIPNFSATATSPGFPVGSQAATVGFVQSFASGAAGRFALANTGSGVGIYINGTSGPQLLRSLTGSNGISVTNTGNTVTIAINPAGSFTAGSINTTGNITTSGEIIAASGEISGPLTVTGAATFNGGASITGGATVSGGLSVDVINSLSDISSGGTITSQKGLVSNAGATILHNLTAGSITTTGDITTSGEIIAASGEISGPLTVTGAASFNGDVSITGGSLKVNGNLGLTGDLDMTEPGNILLADTDSPAHGVIYKGSSAAGNQFIHNFDESNGNGKNTFIGKGAGSFSGPYISNTAIGAIALSSLATQEVVGNTAIGANALAQNTSGNANTAVGNNALGFNLGFANVAVGSDSASNIINGSNNIYLGTSTFGLNDENNTIRIGSTVATLQPTACFIQGINGATSALTAAAVFVDANGQLVTGFSGGPNPASSSFRKVKSDRYNELNDQLATLRNDMQDMKQQVENHSKVIGRLRARLNNLPK